ncbi:hypothetical protein JCGZ_25801 [Jatropha curcas]|uniref:CAAX prenyl protease 2/Lysostaphin resistance protein A-like domain-containing protein n=1 Tax=Jatropha curcas TaxID=180498 RepID=A0A067JX89_JATCU|nr:hypothetical protein JCGZ_25801 [Jatropha curcas]
MLLSLRPTVGALPATFRSNFNKPKLLHCFSISKSNLSFKFSPNCYCKKNNSTDKPTEDFSVLSLDIPWERGSIWSIMAMYMFNLHIPLGVGGLSIVAYLLHQPALDPQTEILSLLVVQILELIGALVLLNTTAKPDHKLRNIFKSNKLSKERNWLLASALGFGSLTLLVFLISFLADIYVGPKAVNNPILKEILLSSNISKAACILVYCLVTPLMEEIIYRGFLLTSLASTMNWQKAVFISSAVFSAAHFSGENFLQLFIIGCVLGFCYSWTGNLSSPIAIHSLYNAVTLIITFVS